MPKPMTLPDLFDDVRSISITKLKGWGYLKPNYQTSFSITWTREGQVTGSIGVRTHMSSRNPFVEFAYSLNGEPLHYKVYLDAVPSNLGKGSVWYFICPQTMKRCRILYFNRGRFVHREGCKDAMYRKQTYSHHTRGLMRLLDAHIDAEAAQSEMHGRNFRTHYKGQQTKRCARLLQKMEGAFQHPYQLEMLLLS